MSVANNETRRSEFRVHPHHEQSDVLASREAYPASVEEREEKSSIFR
jgi:hypothetical protein